MSAFCLRTIAMIAPSLLFWACQPNYFLLHPVEPVAEIGRETEFFNRGGLRVNWLARYPDKGKKLPGILIHPDRGSLAADMEGICLALARRGYFAAAVDYQRLRHLEDRNPLLPWQSSEDALAAVTHLAPSPSRPRPPRAPRIQ